MTTREPDDESASSVYDLADPTRRSEGFAEAKLTLGRSGLVALPTDTVYGVAADAFDPTGVRRLLRAKGRGRSMPTPVLIGTPDTLRALATNLRPETRRLASTFWPGGLTLICRQQPSLRWDLGDSRATVALRMPDQPDALDLLADNGPLAVSSANITGQPAATTVEEARSMLGDAVDVYLDGGPTPGSTASTIVDCTGEVMRVVRVGVVTLAALRAVVPDIEAPEHSDDTDNTEDGDDPDTDRDPRADTDRDPGADADADPGADADPQTADSSGSQAPPEDEGDGHA